MSRIFQSSAHRNAVYTLMLERIDCGPFDGGCLVFAQALQLRLGGSVKVIEGRCLSERVGRQCRYEGDLLAQHAVLCLPRGLYADAAGFADEKNILRRTAGFAHGVASAEAIRDYREGDLQEAMRDEQTVLDLAALLGDPSFRPRVII